MPEAETATTQEETFTDKVNPEELSPEMQKIYKSMQADYTRKTQTIAEDRKRLEEDLQKERDKMEEKLKQYGQTEHEVQQWRTWYKSLEEEVDGEEDDLLKALEEGRSPQSNTTEGEGDKDKRSPQEQAASGLSPEAYKALAKELSSLREEQKNMQGALQESRDQTKRMFSYHSQLAELGGKYEGLDKQKLLEFALDKGYNDLDKAYSDMYRDDIIEGEVQKRVQEALKKERTRGVSSPGRPHIYKPKAETPKNLGDATQAILDERAAEGSLE